MSKKIKGLMIAEIQQTLGDARDMLVIDTAKLDGISTNKLRLALREKSISLLTVKNALARRALHDLGVTTLDHALEGPSVLVWGGEDIVALSKEMTKWAKEIDQLEIKGGTIDGTPLDAPGVTALSKSPGRLELIGQVVGLILSPGARLAGAMLGPGGTISGQLKALSEKDAE